ncbi:MAG: Smr/MutS family protein [Spirochaetales bacterium]|nr:Smr/MutS family protein [Spirochaetales bacterium]
MDFGKILDQWDEQKKSKKTIQNDFNKILEEYLPSEDIVDQKKIDENRAQDFLSIKEIINMKIDKSCDLHGLTLSEARQKTNQFIHYCHGLGYKKILLIHGKGRHSLADPVLQKGIRQFIQNHSLAGRWGVADKKNGGNGATWVLLRYRSR